MARFIARWLHVVVLVALAAGSFVRVGVGSAAPSACVQMIRNWEYWAASAPTYSTPYYVDFTLVSNQSNGVAGYT